jgi:hypothetical protein
MFRLGKGDVMKIKIEYELTATDVGALQKAVDELCLELDRPGILRTQAAALGLNVEDIETFSGFVKVGNAAHGIDAASLAAIVTLSLPIIKVGAKVSEKVLLDVWRKILLPRIVRRFGDGSLSPATSKKSNAKPPAKKKPLAGKASKPKS